MVTILIEAGLAVATAVTIGLVIFWNRDISTMDAGAITFMAVLAGTLIPVLGAKRSKT